MILIEAFKVQKAIIQSFFSVFFLFAKDKL